MEDKELSHEEWLASEQARLDKGFEFEPQPSSAPSEPGTAGQALAGLGLGAGVVGGALAPHPNPVTFEGGKATVIAKALRSELADDDTRVQVDKTSDAVVVTILQSQKRNAGRFSPAVTATMIEKSNTLTVTVSSLNPGSVRDAVTSMGSSLVDQGKRALSRGSGSGVAGLLDVASQMIEGVEDVVEDVQDLRLPHRVWATIDRVGEAAEQAYLNALQKNQELQREREEARRAWTHCEWCGRAYGDDEDSRTDCLTCGGPRGDRPAFLK